MISICTLLFLCGVFNEGLLVFIDATSATEEITYHTLQKPESFEEETADLNSNYSVPLLIRKAGYPAEVHTVQTEDGYLLTLHRIRGPEGSLPVILMHGFLHSSSDWIFLGKGKALAYILADLGYDVWLGNTRGNRFSRAHVSLSTNMGNAKYWNHSINELGMYDLPAIITYVTDLTGKSLEAYIGHSMGAMIYHMMASEHREIQKKVQLMISLAPSTLLNHTNSILKGLSAISDALLFFAYSVGFNELPPFDDLWREMWRKWCSSYFQKICKIALYIVEGPACEQFDATLLQRFFTINPSAMATTLFEHFAQMIKTGRFQKYDYGPELNMKAYNTTEPPEFDLSKVTTPTVLIYSETDFLVNSTDVRILRDKLPNVVRVYKIDRLSHLGFTVDERATELVNKRIVQILKNKQLTMSEGNSDYCWMLGNEDFKNQSIVSN